MRIWALVLWLVATAALVAPDFYRFAEEKSRIDVLAVDLAKGSATASELARAYSDAVHRRLTIDRSAESYGARDRPFLRETAWETWSKARGFCGEASRVIVNMLISQGVPATRINMIGPKFVHTAVAYRDGEKWYLVDSIGAPGDFREWSRQNAKPVSELVSMSFHFGGGTPIRIDNPYFTRYSFFNWGRVIDWAEVNQRVPFPMPITMVIENPPLLTGILKLCGAIFVLLIGWAFFRYRDRSLRRRASEASSPDTVHRT
ncbi:MAG: hypothetical protein GY791_16035 [Alphaproteobacteria bacterium]|nr:hypothetical protein [Alphaproteobacteria bacterium]